MNKEFPNAMLKVSSAVFLIATGISPGALANGAPQTFGQALTEQKNTPSRMESGDSFRLPAAVADNVATPARGSSQQTVLAKFGEPGRREAAVGDPPISVWHYSDFSVFFEYNLALHSVVKPATRSAAQ